MRDSLRQVREAGRKGSDSGAEAFVVVPVPQHRRRQRERGYNQRR